MALMATPTTQTGRWPAPAAGEWTVDMLRELPDDGRRYELLDGVLLVSPAPRTQASAGRCPIVPIAGREHAP